MPGSPKLAAPPARPCPRAEAERAWGASRSRTSAWSRTLPPPLAPGRVGDEPYADVITAPAPVPDRAPELRPRSPAPSRAPTATAIDNVVHGSRRRERRGRDAAQLQRAAGGGTACFDHPYERRYFAFVLRDGPTFASEKTEVLPWRNASLSCSRGAVVAHLKPKLPPARGSCRASRRGAAAFAAMTAMSDGVPVPALKAAHRAPVGRTQRGRGAHSSTSSLRGSADRAR
jgi:hypothetical protein